MSVTGRVVGDNADNAGNTGGSGSSSGVGNPLVSGRLLVEQMIRALEQTIGRLSVNRTVEAQRKLPSLKSQLAGLRTQHQTILNQEAAWAASNDFGSVESTPTIMDALAYFGGGTSGGSRGSGGGGGSAAGSAADAARMSEAYRAMLAALNGQYDQTDAAFGDQENRLGSLRDAGAQRLAGILDEARGTAATTRQQVGDAYRGGDATLAGLQEQFRQMGDTYRAGADRTLGAFGVQPERVQRPGGNPLDLVAAQRATLSAQGANADANYANRGNVYNGLFSDVSTSNSQAYEGLLLQLSQQRAAAAAKRAADLAQVKIDAARSGVTL